MDGVALILWAVTAAGGTTLAVIWLAGNGPAAHRAGRSRLAPIRVAAHGGLAAAGLSLWVAYTRSERAVPGWMALALLLLVALLGGLLFLTWLAGRGADRADAPEQRFPVVLVAAHGVAAVATLVAVLVALVA